MSSAEQLILDIKTKKKDILRNKKFLQEKLQSISNILETNVVDKIFYKFKKGGRGVTGLLLLKESHISIHTWPEFSSATIDIFSCKRINVELVKKFIMKNFEVKKFKCRKFTRRY
jgi:S-adenosylmethionine decarboxylase